MEKKSDSEVIHDYSKEGKHHIEVEERDKPYLLCIHVRGYGPKKPKREEYIIFNKDGKPAKYLITSIRFYKNNNFKAEIIFIQWLD
jgi:hypothetical protein